MKPKFTGKSASRIVRAVRRFKLGDPKADRTDTEYWSTRTPDERVEAVEKLRYQYCMMKYGRIPVMEKVVRIIKLKDDTGGPTILQSPPKKALRKRK